MLGTEHAGILLNYITCKVLSQYIDFSMLQHMYIILKSTQLCCVPVAVKMYLLFWWTDIL